MDLAVAVELELSGLPILFGASGRRQANDERQRERSRSSAGLEYLQRGTLLRDARERGNSRAGNVRFDSDSSKHDLEGSADTIGPWGNHFKHKERTGLLRAGARDTATRMNFGKFAFGALILAVGVLLLAVRLGFAHPDTPLFLLRFWPILLIAFGLAFLASAIKNPFLGCLAVLLILGGTALGVLWMNRRPEQGSGSVRVSAVDLSKTNPESLSARVRTFAGTFYIGGDTPPSKRLSVRVRTFSADSAVGYRYAVSGKTAVLEWPSRTGAFGLPAPAMGLDVRVPETLPMTLSWRGLFASIHADLTRLKPTWCTFHGVASSILLGIKGAARPEEIRVWGFCSSMRIKIHGDCPVRLMTHGPFVMKSLQSDFEEHAMGRGRDRIYAVEGRGRPVRIFVDGPFIRIKIERLP